MPFIFYAKNSKYVEIFKAICHYVYKSVTIHGSLQAINLSVVLAHKRKFVACKLPVKQEPPLHE
jgi:hypothetical protein